MHIPSLTVAGCVSVSVFTSLVCVPVEITSSAVGINTCVITARIKKSIINKDKKKHNKIVLVGKDNLNTLEVLISKVLIDSHIRHKEFVSVNNVLREYNEMKKELKNPQTSVEYNTLKQWKPIVSVVKNILQTKIQVPKNLIEID